MTDPTNPFWGQQPGPGFGTGTGADVNRLHDYDDVDIGGLSHHHTLGILSGQSSPGDHKHDGKTSAKIGLITRVSSNTAQTATGTATGSENQDTGIGVVAFNPINTAIYLIRYKGRIRADLGVQLSADVFIKWAVAPATPTAASPALEGVSDSIETAGGGGARAFSCEGLITIPTDLAVAKYNLACFYKKTGGAAAGTVNVDQTAGSRRQLSIRLDGWS
jgi:hypothetical protein